MKNNSSIELNTSHAPVAKRHWLSIWLILSSWCLVLLPAAVFNLQLIMSGSIAFADLLMVSAMCFTFLMMCIGGICDGMYRLQDRSVIIGAAIHLFCLATVIGLSVSQVRTTMMLQPWMMAPLFLAQGNLIDYGLRRVKQRP